MLLLLCFFSIIINIIKLNRISLSFLLWDYFDPKKSFLPLKRESVRLDSKKKNTYTKRNVVNYVNNSI